MQVQPPLHRSFEVQVLFGNWVVEFGSQLQELVEIDLSNATELRDSAAAAVAEAKNLERLWLGRCKLITDIGIGCIAVGCRKLRLISLKWCLGIGDLGVELIAVKCKEIRCLDLSYLPITDKCLPSILKLQNLEDLVLEGCFGIDDDSLAPLKYGCKSLKKLDMSSCQNISYVGLSSLSGAGETLQELTLAYVSPVTLAFANSLKKLPMLQTLKLDGCLVTSAGLKAIGNWMESCTLVPREAFVLIGQRCHSLEEIDLTDNEVDDEGLKSISRCSKLSSLKLGICLNITDKGVVDIGMHCSKLTELDLYRCTGITDLGISAIAYGCPGLEMINISYCKDITDSSLRSSSHRCRMQATNKLDIKKCSNIDDTGMIPLAHFSQNLRQINLSYTSVTDVGLLSLASISCLQSLTILHLNGLTPGGLAASLWYVED
ncbi:hypothetical protein FEM48_ZijujUnG0111700 [Ziziphus jujuba var. spinosa]|uniref:F-box/LRR-repeat protein 15-like leucin rich repeat domain-containing protein n=1 Tax=Ziziphus jujuba var. spinosa TaxID=714518 RepID=A0A978U804_ZIZJJ|nr:hypothetical protein FEM48_ZijujUnG0111700 [Ziziphus jujuba var. spinosa]